MYYQVLNLLLLLIINFQTSDGGQFLLSIVPVICYSSADVQKTSAIKENTGKSGIYRWTNTINGKSYIGSSFNLGDRFRGYYSFTYLNQKLENSRSLIYSALLNYGYSVFKLEILEYCDSEDLIKKEQYYIDKLKPKYNILLKAGSSFGYKHTEEALAKIKI